MYWLFATTFNQFGNRPLALFNASLLRGSATNRAVHLAKVVIREIQRNRSLKVFQLLTECVCQPRESAAVHSQGVILLFNMRCGNEIHVWHSGNDRALGLYNLCRTVSAGGFLVEIRYGVCFYHLPVVHFRTETALNRVRIRRQRVS